jgi:ABC-type multidrug transport system ATPase subunit
VNLTIDGLSVWLPTRGTVLASVSAELTGVTLVVGRNGRGASTLLRGLAGRLMLGARVTGRVDLDGHAVFGLTAQELAGAVDSSQLADDPGASRQQAAERLERALANREARVLVLDQPLADLVPERRPAALAAIRERAADGTVVVWADHLVEEALAACDQVLEIIAPDRIEQVQRASWVPRTLPAPPGLALARAMNGEVSADGSSGLAGLIPHLRDQRRVAGDRLTTAVPEVTRLDRPLDLSDGVCLGIVSADGDREVEVDLARRLVAVARGEAFLAEPLAVPRASRVGDLVRVWERRHRLAPDSVAAYVDPLARLGADRAVDRHSPGERAALAWGLALSRPGGRLLIEPTRGMDPAARRHVARTLYDEPRAFTCLVSSDVEVLTRACHRIVVIGDGAIVADGAPLTVLDRLPHQPELARRGARAVRVRDLVPTTTEVALR